MICQIATRLQSVDATWTYAPRALSSLRLRTCELRVSVYATFHCRFETWQRAIALHVVGFFVAKGDHPSALRNSAALNSAHGLLDPDKYVLCTID
jgi:hypothetical protein